LVALSFAAPLFGGAADAATQAGVTAAVRGTVDLTPVIDQAVRPIGSGEDVFLGDALKSHEQSGLQLMLLDETSITLGPNADLTVDEFVYDPATGVGEVAVSLAEGVFRFVTGKTSQGQDKAMTLKVPFGVIGVRGTIGAVRNTAVLSLIVLLGPGLNNNADQRSGALDVTAQGQTVSLIRPRFGTIIEAGQPPSPPFELSDEQLASILAPLAPPPLLPPERPPSVDTAVRQAAQDIAEGRAKSGETGETYAAGDLLIDPFDAAILAGVSPEPPGGFDTLPIQGQFEFENSFSGGNTVPLSTGGVYEFSLDVDFALREIGSSFSNIEVFEPALGFAAGPPGPFGLIPLPAQSFDNSLVSGFPVFEFSGQITGGGNCPCDFDVGVIIVNSGNNIDHSLTVTDGNVISSGSGTSALGNQFGP